MQALWDWLFDPSGLTPHGFCLIWAPGLIGLHVVADLVTGCSYFSIPLALGWFVRARSDLHYRWVIYLFSAFILACGMTHMLSIVTLWVPAYGLEGMVKLATAGLSVATAVQLWPLIPRLLAMPSPAQLSFLNQQLSTKIAEQEQTAELLRGSEARVRAANEELERRVFERTADLTTTNAQLVAALEMGRAAEAKLQAAKRDLEDVVAQRTRALRERDALLREVYHRVKNNLQIVDSLVLLQARQFSDLQSREAFLDLRSRIYALSLAHQQLMSSQDLETFDIAPFLKKLVTNIFDGSRNRGLAVSVQACELIVTLDFAVPLGLLVTELVTNSIKETEVRRVRQISVDLGRAVDGNILLIVVDDGQGATGSDEPLSGLAAPLTNRIVRGLVTQLEGTMSVNYNEGLRIEVVLAVAEHRR